LPLARRRGLAESVVISFRNGLWLLELAKMISMFSSANAWPNFTLNDTIGDYNGAPGIGAGEPFNTQLSAKIIF
jgi:hypothetical protein